MTDRARWDLPDLRDLRVRADREEKGDRWGQWGREAFRVLRDRRASRDRSAQLLRQYMHNTEIAVTMRLSTILKTIKQPL